MYINIIVVTMLFILNIPNLDQLTPRIFIKERLYDESPNEELNIANYISSNIDKGSRILIVTDTIVLVRMNYLTTYKYDLSISNTYLAASAKNAAPPIDIMTDEMKGFDYVFFDIESIDGFNKVNDCFKEYTNCNTIYNYVLYKIQKSDKNEFLYMMT